MPGKKIEENIKRFGGKKNNDMYEAVKKSCEERKKKKQGGKELTKEQEQNCKATAAKIVNSKKERLSVIQEKDNR